MNPLIFFFLLTLFSSPLTTGASRCTTATMMKTYEKCMNLQTQDASIAWTYHSHNSTLEISFTGSFISPSGWVGFGFNPTSPEMTGSRVLIAFSDPSTGSLIALPFLLDSSVKLQRGPLTSRPLDIPLLSSSATLRPTSSAVRDGAAIEIYAVVRLPFNRTRNLHLVWNRGLYVQGYSPTIHPTSPADLASTTTVDLLSAASFGHSTAIPHWVRPTHAILNSISWGFLLPTGVAVARYIRQLPSTTSTPAYWFYIHSTVQVFGFCVGVCGFILGLLLGSASIGIEYGVHRGLGIAAVVMASGQSLALVLRPRTTNRFRKYWKSYHHLVGYGCVVVGVVNVFQGFEVMGMERSYGKLAYCLALGTIIGACIAMEVNAWVVFCRKAQEEKIRKETAAGGGVGVKLDGGAP